jgi:tetratricopeptide (TPR) repeat protein
MLPLRHRLFTLLLFPGLLCAATAAAQPTEALRHFDAGNQHYNEGRYSDAISAYRQAYEAGHASGALYFNMGNAYYRLDEVGQAIRYYEKARLLIPESNELLHNLEIARARTQDQFSQLPTPFWVVWWRNLVTAVGALGFFITGLVFYLAAAALVGYPILRGTRGPWYRRSLTVAVLGGLLFFGAAFTASLGNRLNRSAVLLSSQAVLRTAPLPDASTELSIHEGLVLRVLQEQDHWIEVRLPNGTTGWLETDTVGEI